MIRLMEIGVRGGDFRGGERVMRWEKRMDWGTDHLVLPVSGL